MVALALVLALYLYWVWYRHHTIPNEDGSPYLTRYILCRVPFGPRVFLHKIWTKDPGRDHHNHPWLWAKAYILRGGYTEVRTRMGWNRDLKKHYVAGDTNYIGPHVYHSIVSVLPNTWTLFVAGPRKREWGFLVPGPRHVDWRTYLKVDHSYQLRD